ncbi:unnamed protein product, partial [Clonostachys rosea f. rosea IK726]
GSIDEIAEIATAQILPYFLELQGKPLTAEIVHKIHEEQFEDPTVWTETDIGGYLLVGLDDRDIYYIRYYAGQLYKLSIRSRYGIVIPEDSVIIYLLREKATDPHALSGYGQPIRQLSNLSLAKNRRNFYRMS